MNKGTALKNLNFNQPQLSMAVTSKQPNLVFDRIKNVFISYRFHYSISETPGYPCQNPFSYGHKVPLSGIDLHHAQLSRHGASNFSYELGLFLVYLTVLVVCNEIVLGVPFP